MSFQLPNEILTSILNLVSLKDRYNCQLVCRYWFIASRPVCYQQVKVNNTNLLSLLRSFDAHQFQPFSHVKSLTIHFYPYFNCQRLLDKDEFTRLIQYCVQLERLMIAPNSIYWDYLSYIPDLCLKQLSYPEKPRRLPSKTSGYYSSLYNCRDSLTRLDIHCACDYWIRTHFNHLTHYLAEFPKLTDLTIDGGSQLSIIHLNRVLKTCSGLRKLSFGSDHPFAETDDRLISSYPSLEELDIFLPEFRLSSLDYIQGTFSHLQHLKLRVFYDKNHGWTNEQSEYIQAQMIPFLKQLRTYSIKFDMETGCEPIESAILSHWPQTPLVVALDISESGYERTQLDLIKGEQYEIRFTKTWSPYHTVHPYIKYLEVLGPWVIELSIKNYPSSPSLDSLLCLCPQLQSLTLISPSKDTQMSTSGYRHCKLNRLMLEQVYFDIQTIQALYEKSETGIQYGSIINSHISYNYSLLDSKDLLKDCFSFVNHLVLKNTTILMKNDKGQCGARVKYSLAKLSINK